MPTPILPGLLISFLIAVPQSNLDVSQVYDAYQSETVTLEDGELTLAQQLVFAEESGAANRIVAASYLRTLTQEIAAAACHLHEGIAVDQARELLAYSAAKFDAITVALRDGDEAMGIIGGETRPRTIAQLDSLIEAWLPVREASIAVIQTPEDQDAISVIYASADTLYETSYVFLSKIEGQYAVPSEILFQDVMLLEISARMAAMTQRISYESCRVMSGSADATYAAELVEAKDIFYNGLLALRNGEPSLGIVAAPTEQIATALSEVSEDWYIIAAYLRAGLDGEVLPPKDREDLYIRMADKLHKIEEIEKMYQAYSERV